MLAESAAHRESSEPAEFAESSLMSTVAVLLTDLYLSSIHHCGCGCLSDGRGVRDGRGVHGVRGVRDGRDVLDGRDFAAGAKSLLRWV